jgi:hypothetical protein
VAGGKTDAGTRDGRHRPCSGPELMLNFFRTGHV